MTTVSDLLQQIKENEERDLAYAKKIKNAEILIKDEQDIVKKLKVQQKELSDGLKRKYFRCSEKEIRKEILQQQKRIWEHLLEEAHKNLREEEKKVDELHQSVCLNRLALYNDIKGFLEKKELLNSSNSYCQKYLSPIQFPIKTKIEDENYESIMEELASLESELEELKGEENEIEKAKELKVEMEAEPSCGEEFLRIQKELKETKDVLKKAEEEISTLKNHISQKEFEIFSKVSNASTVNSSQIPSQVLGENSIDIHQKYKRQLMQPKMLSQRNSSAKTVTFNSSVEMKNISPTPEYKTSEDRTELSGHSTPRKKLTAQQLTSQLDEAMRDILFK